MSTGAGDGPATSAPHAPAYTPHPASAGASRAGVSGVSGGSGGPGGVVGDDADLALAASQGDSRALAELYRRHAATVHAVLLVRVGRSDADDLTQEVFVRALRGIADLRDDAAVAGWLVRVAKNLAIDHARARERWGWVRRGLEARARATQDAASRQRSAVVESPRWSAGEVLDAILALPFAYQESLALRLVARLTGPEIAAALDMTEGAVRVNLSRGMGLLKEKLGISAGDAKHARTPNDVEGRP